MAMGIRACLL